MTFQLDTSGFVDGPCKTSAGRKLWSDLDPFTQGYIEAVFAELFDPTKRGWKFEPAYNGFVNPSYHPNGPANEFSSFPSDVCAHEAWETDFAADEPAFRDLAPETLARIIEDCAAYSAAFKEKGHKEGGAQLWHCRQHGGMSKAGAQRFPPLTVTLDDDGKVRFE